MKITQTPHLKVLNKNKVNPIGLSKLVVIIIINFFTFNINAQIISYFTWENPDITQADIGPNFVAGNLSAYSGTGGAGGTNGLNSGLPKRDLNLVLLDNPIFDVDGIDISVDFQRDETIGSFFTRGNSLVMKGGANLSVRYRVDDGAGGFTTINSGNVFSIPNGSTYNNYRFYYLPNTGVGALAVNDVVVWSNDGPDNRNMYWAGSGNIIIGSGLDGSGYNRAFLDNLVIAEVLASPLPIELVSFEANVIEESEVELNWETVSEINNAYFSIERSIDDENWETIQEIEGANNSIELIAYSTIDTNPIKGVSYYRLKQTDYNGTFTYSDIKVVEITLDSEKNTNIHVYPNPTVDIIYIKSTDIENLRVYSSIGRDVTFSIKEISRTESTISYSVGHLLKGVYFVKNNTTAISFIKK